MSQSTPNNQQNNMNPTQHQPQGIRRDEDNMSGSFPSEPHDAFPGDQNHPADRAIVHQGGAPEHGSGMVDDQAVPTSLYQGAPNELGGNQYGSGPERASPFDTGTEPRRQPDEGYTFQNNTEDSRPQGLRRDEAQSRVPQTNPTAEKSRSGISLDQGGPTDHGLGLAGDQTAPTSLHQGAPYDLGVDQQGTRSEQLSQFDTGTEPRRGIERYEDRDSVPQYGIGETARQPGFTENEHPQHGIQRNEAHIPGTHEASQRDQNQNLPSALHQGGQYAPSSDQNGERHTSRTQQDDTEDSRPQGPRRDEARSRVLQTHPTSEKSLPSVPLHQGGQHQPRNQNNAGDDNSRHANSGTTCHQCGDAEGNCNCASGKAGDSKLCHCGPGESCDNCSAKQRSAGPKQGGLTALTGKVEHALGVMLGDQDMKQKGLEKQPGKIAHMQNQSLAEAERTG